MMGEWREWVLVVEERVWFASRHSGKPSGTAEAVEARLYTPGRKRALHDQDSKAARHDVDKLLSLLCGGGTRSAAAPGILAARAGACRCREKANQVADAA
jgi:hypothetical protein